MINIAIFHSVYSVRITIGNAATNFKLHPRELHYEHYVKLGRDHPQWNMTVHPANCTRQEFYKAIQQCDVFIHYGSNAALEGMIIDRPIVTLNILKDIYISNHWLKALDMENACLNVDIDGNITQTIIRALSDEPELKQKRKNIVDLLCGKLDGKAATRIVQFMYEVAEWNEKKR